MFNKEFQHSTSKVILLHWILDIGYSNWSFSGVLRSSTPPPLFPMKLQPFVVALLLLLGTKLLAQDMPTVQLGPLYTDAQYRSWNLPSRSVLKLHEGKVYAMLPRLVKSEKVWGLDFVVFDEEMQFEKQVHIPLKATKRYKIRQTQSHQLKDSIIQNLSILRSSTLKPLDLISQDKSVASTAFIFLSRSMINMSAITANKLIPKTI